MRMKKTKVAFCLRDMRIGGAEACLIRVLEGLLQRDDLEIIMVTYAKIQEPIYQQWFADHPQIKTYALYPCSWLGTNLSRVFFVRPIQHLIRNIYRATRRKIFGLRKFRDVDVWVDYYEFGFVDELKKISKPKITWWHSSVNKLVDGNWARKLANYDTMVVLTQDFEDAFKELYPQYADKIQQIYNPINVENVRALARRGSVDNQNKYFVSVARLQRDKDIETLLRAFDVFWQKNNKPDVDLIIVGWGSLAGHFQSIAASLSAAKNIKFVGAQNNPFGFMAGAIANILSSYSEGLPTVLIEGAICETLNISSDCKNGPREILMDGQAGILYPAGDVDALAAAMNAAYNGRVDAKKMIDVATRNLDRFNAENVCEKIVELIKRA